MQTLTQVITKLEQIRAEYGELNCYHYTCEAGLSDELFITLEDNSISGYWENMPDKFVTFSNE